MGMIFNMAGLVRDGKRGKQEQETTAATTGVDCKNAQAGKSANTSTVVSTNSAASASAIGGDGSSKQSQSQAQIQAQSQIQTQAQTQSLTRFDQLLVPVTIEQAGLQPNDLILLEEGPLPRRGMMKFKVCHIKSFSLRLQIYLLQPFSFMSSKISFANCLLI
jgi:hypothetical protein